jgi:hypothetical protein
MFISLSFLRSLLISSTFSFTAPVVLIGTVLSGLSVIGQVPIVDQIGRLGAAKLLEFLVVFGNGDAIEGLLVIATTCALVGALFDTYAFYREHNLRDS